MSSLPQGQNLMYIENGDTPTGCVADKKTIIPTEIPKVYRNGIESIRRLGFSGISEKTDKRKGSLRISPLQVSPEGFHRN